MPSSQLKTIGGRNKNRKTVKKTGKVSWIKFVTNHYYQQSKKNKKWTFKDSLKQCKKIRGKSQKNNIKKGGESNDLNSELQVEPSNKSPPAEPSNESPPVEPSNESSTQVNLTGGKKKNRTKR